MDTRVFVVRMHLNGEIVMRVDELDEQRELLRIHGACGRQCVRCVAQIFQQGHAGVVAVIDHAHAVVTHGQFPRFCQLRKGSFLIITLLQTVAAPKNLLGHRAQLHRVFLHHGLTPFLVAGSSFPTFAFVGSLL